MATRPPQRVSTAAMTPPRHRACGRSAAPLIDTEPEPQPLNCPTRHARKPAALTQNRPLRSATQTAAADGGRQRCRSWAGRSHRAATRAARASIRGVLRLPCGRAVIGGCTRVPILSHRRKWEKPDGAGYARWWRFAPVPGCSTACSLWHATKRGPVVSSAEQNTRVR